MASLPYLNLAILHMPVTLLSTPPGDKEGFLKGRLACATDGQRIRWEIASLLRAYQQSPAEVARCWLHMILHCVYLHPFSYDLLHTAWWDIAADIAVEHTIRGLHLAETASTLDARQEEAEARLLRDLADEVTAEAIYHAMRSSPDLAAALEREAGLFHRDSHDLWALSSAEARLHQPSPFARTEKDDSPRQQWQKIRVNVRVLEDHVSNRRGDTAGQRTFDLGEIKPAWRDYAALLRKYAVLTEVSALDLDEFDYIYYIYGLRLYGRLPLVEPLEYREIRQVRELVIAIDTSGSTQGEKVRGFLAQTYAILNHASLFHEQLRLRLIQCDCEIQSDEVITSREAFLHQMRHVEVRGGGGTSFVPVFDHVRALMAGGEMNDLQGIIYFTDGYGRFPAEDPGIRTAFVLYDSDCEDAHLPVWAEVVRLREE